MREKKKRSLLNAYEEKVSNDTFKRNREERRHSKTQIYQAHEKMGEHMCFDNEG